jgi:hypothetical protein
VRILTARLMALDVWTPGDIAEFAGIEYKAALKTARRLPHLRNGRRYLVARVVVLQELGLDQEGRPIGSGSHRDPAAGRALDE